MRSIDERILEAVEKCGGGPLPKKGLRTIAIGSDRTVTAADFDEALTRLVAVGELRAEWVRHFIGRGGSGCWIFTSLGS